MQKLPVQITLDKHNDVESEEFEVVVNVENLTDRSLTGLNLVWRHDYDDVLNGPTRKLNTITEFFQLGDGPLSPGDSRQFVYPQEHLLALLSVVDALSPERYSIDIQIDGTTERAMEGSVFGGWLQGEFG